MIVCVSVSETLCRSVIVKIPDGRPTDDAVNLIREKYKNGDIVLDSDDFDFCSKEVKEAYTEIDEKFMGEIDYVV